MIKPNLVNHLLTETATKYSAILFVNLGEYIIYLCNNNDQTLFSNAFTLAKSKFIGKIFFNLIYYCPIEIIKGLSDKGQFQCVTKFKGPPVGITCMQHNFFY